VVDYFRKVFRSSWDGLHEAALVLALSSFASQLLALIRDRIFAHKFGTGPLLDLYYASFRVPDLIFVLVASLVSLSVMVPYLSRELEGKPGEAKALISSVFKIFSVILILVCALAYVFMPFLATIIAPGFEGESATQLVTLSRILLLSPFFLGVSGFLASIVQTHKRFLVYALSPILYNFGIIFGALCLYPYWGLPGLVGGVLLGALMHALVLLPTVVSLGMMPSVSGPILWSKIREVFLVSLPRTFALGVHQIVLVVFTSLASLLGSGAISSFTFAINLQSVPLSLVGMSYATAAFPTLASYISKGDNENFQLHLSRAARHIIFWSFPVIALVVVLRAQIVRVILGSGSFDWTSTRLVAAALALFTISAVAQGLVLLFTRAAYAKGDTKFPFFVNFISAVVMVLGAKALIAASAAYPTFRYFMEALLRVEGVPGTAMLWLPMAYTLGMIVAMALYVARLEKEAGIYMREIWRGTVEALYSAVLAGFVAYQALSYFEKLFDLDTLPGIFMQGFLAGVVGIIACALMLKIFGNAELLELSVAVRRRFWETKPVLPPPEETTAS
jgi:putative peptidoglycan lipid II flippase